jgi:myo-inositol catabolism protein IolS
MHRFVERRSLGRSGIGVSVIGMGGWAIGGDAWGPVDDRESLDAIACALERGITFFDTADVYGRGHSESLLGRALRGRRDDVVICTKVGLWDSHADVKPNIYSNPESIVRCCEASLRRLGTDWIDVYLCHLWWDENVEAFLEAFEHLQRAGKIRSYGVSTDNGGHLRHFDQHGTCAVVQVEYSLFNRAAEREVLPYCRERDIGVIVRGPLYKGLLTGKFDTSSTFPEGDLRQGWPNEPWFLEALGLVEQLSVLEQGDRDLAQVALRFVLDQPGVHTAIPGAKTRGQVDANVRAAGASLGEEDLRLIEELAPAGQLFMP